MFKKAQFGTNLHLLNIPKILFCGYIRCEFIYSDLILFEQHDIFTISLGKLIKFYILFEEQLIFFIVSGSKLSSLILLFEQFISTNDNAKLLIFSIKLLCISSLIIVL